jgi:hypothetical protein
VIISACETTVMACDEVDAWNIGASGCVRRPSLKFAKARTPLNPKRQCSRTDIVSRISPFLPAERATRLSSRNLRLPAILLFPFAKSAPLFLMAANSPPTSSGLATGSSLHSDELRRRNVQGVVPAASQPSASSPPEKSKERVFIVTRHGVGIGWLTYLTRNQSLFCRSSTNGSS